MTDDWTEALRALLEADARFLVVGAHALAVHGVPRATADLDVWVEPTPENAHRVWTGLAAFGAPLEALGITVDDFHRAETVVQVGLPPSRIDLLTSITGIEDFELAWSGRVQHEVEGMIVPFLGRAALIRNKRATGRLRDLADLEALENER